jgi:hypothetical protein
MHVACLIHSILFDLNIIIILVGFKFWSTSLYNVLHSSFTFSVLSPNILLRTLFYQWILES